MIFANWNPLLAILQICKAVHQGGYAGHRGPIFSNPFSHKKVQTQAKGRDGQTANLLQGVILFAVLAADFFTRFKLVKQSKEVA